MTLALHRSRIVLALCLLGSLSLLWSLTGCRQGERKTELRKTSVRLLWLGQAQFAGLYVAQRNGYFKDQGLLVNIEPGGPDISPVLLVASGSNDFGIAAGTDILQARSNGVPVVAVASIFQRNPVVFFSKKEKNITSPKDFPGHTVGIKYGLEIEYYFNIMIKKAGVDIRRVKQVPIKFDMARFFSGDVDVWSGYAINEPITAEEKGLQLNLIFCDEWGVPAVGDTIFATEEMLRRDPEKVSAFLRAVTKGWQQAINDPDGAVAATLAANPSLDRDHERRMFNAAIPLIRYGGKPIGSIDPEKWRLMHSMMVESGLLKAPIEVDKAYNRTFIQMAYAGP